MKVDVSNAKQIIEKELDSAQIETVEAAVHDWHKKLEEGTDGSNMTGWVKLPTEIAPELIDKIEKTALEIKNKCTLFIVVGIGGSYLGARAINDALMTSSREWPEVVFAGFHMSAAYLERLCERIKTESVCICAISKSGGTLEPLLSYSILREKVIAKYGVEEARNRIYVITDSEQGKLREDAEDNGFTSFEVPDDIGGRYSVLTAVGLLPIAVAGHNIRALLAGAHDMQTASERENDRENLLQYASTRIALQKVGKTVEIFEYFEQDFRYFGEWMKQLFGETEGKEGKGAYPACLCFTRDLHSIGQFLQQGNQIFYETMISVENHNFDFRIPEFAGKPYAGKTLEQINDAAEEGVKIAHASGGIPVITISIPRVDEYNIGQMIYFFEMSAAVSAYTLGVNPFDQPGVEAYKRETRKIVEGL